MIDQNKWLLIIQVFQEAVSSFLTVIQKMMMTLLHYLSAWYNIMQPSACVCVSTCFKQVLIFQWLNFGQFTLFQQH